MLKRSLGWLFWRLNSLICSTLKYEVKNEPKQQALFALWHGESYPLFYWAQHRRLCLYPSNNWRGDILDHLAKRYGYKTIRFSDSGTPLQRSEGLIAMLEVLKNGFDAAIAVDGPPQPQVFHQAKPGIILLSKKSNVPIVPVVIKAKRKLSLWRWDRYQVPLPFSRVEIIFGRPFVATDKTTTQELEGSLLALS
jgi:lysophospholipid acyltransferase (LPLAT)-like uncharacterized protein